MGEISESAPTLELGKVEERRESLREKERGERKLEDGG